MTFLLALGFAYWFTWNLPRSAYRNPGGWRFPKAEVRALQGVVVGVVLAVGLGG
jgi:hypothetical protein